MASDDDIFSHFQFPDTRSRSSSISNISTSLSSKAIVPVGRIIHRVEQPGGSALGGARRPDATNSRLSASNFNRALVPLDDRDVPYFCPDTKHTASLHRVSNVYQELNTERAWLVTENDKVTRQKRMVVEELRQLELTLKQLMERKVALQKGLVTLQTKEDSTVTQIEALDKKIGLIGEKSVEFEELVRGIAGTPQYELGPDIESIEHEQTDTARCLRVLDGHSAPVQALSIGSDQANQLYSCGDDGTLRVWDTSMFTCTATLAPSEMEVTRLNCISVHNQVAAVGNADGEVALWDIQTRSELHRKLCHHSPVECIQLLGDCFITGSGDYTAQVWGMPTGSGLQKLEGHTGAITCLMAREAEDCTALVTGSMDGTVKLWDTRQADCHRTWQVDQSGVVGLVFDESRVFTADSRGTIKVWDLRGGSIVSSLNLGSPVTCITKNQDTGDAVIACGSSTGKIHICSLVSDVLKPMPGALEGHTGSVTTIGIDSASTLWSGGTDNTLRMWKLPDTAVAQWSMERSNASLPCTLQTNFFLGSKP